MSMRLSHDKTSCTGRRTIAADFRVALEKHIVAWKITTFQHSYNTYTGRFLINIFSLAQLFEREICNGQFQLINNHEQRILIPKKKGAVNVK